MIVDVVAKGCLQNKIKHLYLELVQTTFDPNSLYENLECNLLKFQICKISPLLDFSGTLDIFTLPDIYHKDPLPQGFYETIYYLSRVSASFTVL